MAQGFGGVAPVPPLGLRGGQDCYSGATERPAAKRGTGDVGTRQISSTFRHLARQFWWGRGFRQVFPGENLG